MEDFDIQKETKIEAGEYNYLLRDGVDKFLNDFCKQNNPKNVLEIGTAFGYSAFVILSACNCVCTSIEIDVEKTKLATQNLQKKNLLNRCNIVCADALDFIKQSKEKYDLIFLDGPKGQYIKYLPYLVNLLNVGGYLIADNIYFQGKVLQKGFVPHKHRTIIYNLREFIYQITNSNILETKLLDLGDGLSISKRTQ